MARETFFTVQSFVAGRGGSLKADKPVACKSADAARRMAERIASDKLGVVAMESSSDAELGDFDEQPIVLFKSGSLPDAFDC
jgi:hypothetical protein